MDSSLIPYRKVTLRGVAFVAGQCELQEILAQTEKSLALLNDYGKDNKHYQCVKQWQEKVVECIEDQSKTQAFKEWVRRQDIYGIRDSSVEPQSLSR